MILFKYINIKYMLINLYNDNLVKNIINYS